MVAEYLVASNIPDMREHVYIPYDPARIPEDLRIWAREMRGSMTNAEAMMWQLLRNRRLAGAKFRRQHPLGRYILDFYCDETKLCVELDGSQHMDELAYDKHRDQWIQSQGIQVLRFWNNQVLNETEGVMEVIYRALDVLTCTLTPCPSPACGRGES